MQDYVSQSVLDPLRESERTYKRPASVGATAPAVAAFLAEEGNRVASASSNTQLLQRLATLEAIADKLEQRLSVLEQGQLSRLSPLVKTAPTDTRFQCAEDHREALLLAVVPTHEYTEPNEAQVGSVVDEQSTAPLSPLGTLSLEAQRKGLTTNQLLARLKTNPTTLKKYLRDLKQIRWAVQRDPEGLGWFYHAPLQCYYPLRVESGGDFSTQGLLPSTVDVVALPEVKPRHDMKHKQALDSVKHGQLFGRGGLYQSDLAKLTGIPINTLQRWKHLPDCAERMRCRTEGQYCYWYAKQAKRFYPLNVPTDPSFCTVPANY